MESITTTVTGALTGFLPAIGTVAAAALAVGAGILLYQRAWGFFKKMSK